MPTVITLAIYFCFADLVLISQCVYYNHINAKKDRKRLASVASAISEEEPLLNRRRSSDTTGLPGSHRRPSSINSHRHDTLSKILEEGENENESHWKKNVLSILAVILAGALGWAIAWQSGVWLATPEEGAGNGVPHSTQIAVGAQILGYVSAVCYLGSVHTFEIDHVPQVTYMNQCAYPSNHQKLPREILQRSCAPLLLALAYGKCLVWRQYPLPLAGERLHLEQPSLAHWLPRHDG